MPQLVRHQIGAILLEELRQRGLGVRDLFEGRQEPLSWHFRGVAYDQSELDILESGAVETLHAPSALVELVVDEMALACANLGRQGVASYLVRSGEEGEPFEPGDLAFHPEALLGYLAVDAAPPARWLDHRRADPEENERLSNELAAVAHELGEGADDVEVHIEGAVDARRGWDEVDPPTSIRPAGVTLYFSFDVPLDEVSELTLSRVFGRGADVAARTLERIRELFRGEPT